MVSTTEANVRRIREFCSLVQEGKRIDLFEEYIHQDFCDHPLTGGVTEQETARKFMKGLHTSVDQL